MRTKPFFASVIATALYCILFFGVAAVAINPGVGEGADLDATSFRYRAGDFLDNHVILILAVPFLPGLVLREFMHLPGGAWDYFTMPISLCVTLWLLLLFSRCAFPPHQNA